MKNIISKTITKKIVVTLIVVAIGIMSYTAVLDLLIEKTYFGKLDDRASTYFSHTIKRALVTFAIARAFNATISLLQDSEISISPWGVGATLAVGELLDPINDIVERFSWVMLISTTSLGIQKILMEIGVWFGIKILISFSMAIILIGIWIPRISNVSLMSLGYKLIIVAIVIRFCIPLIAVASDKVYDLFLKDKYAEATQSLEEINDDIKDSNLINENVKKEEKDSGFWDKVNIMRKVGSLKDTVSNGIKYIINLIIVFTLQTIVIPIVLLWALIKLTGYVFGSGTSKVVEEKIKGMLNRGIKGLQTKEEVTT